MFSNKISSIQGGVNVIGSFQSSLGLAESARLLVASLEKKRIPFSLISADFITPHLKKEMYPYKFCQKGKYATNLFCVGFDPEEFSYFLFRVGRDFIKNRHNILLFFWETNVLSKKRARVLSYFDEIWVTTSYIQKILSSAISLPVHLIPQPIQLNYKQAVSNKEKFGLDNYFTFLFCFDFFSCFERKNPTAIIKAFRQAFPGKQDVRLVIKSQNGHHHFSKLQTALEDIKGDARIKWIDESMDKNGLYDLINACDCYVSLHRSEGFGLSMAEAMLMEKPVIATGYSGNLDFTTEKNSFLCGYALISVGPNNQPYPSRGIWADVNIDEAALWMRYVISHPVETKAKALLGKKNILFNHSLDAVGECVDKKLREILADKNVRKRKGGQFIYVSFCFDIFMYSMKGFCRPLKKSIKKAIYLMMRLYKQC